MRFLFLLFLFFNLGLPAEFTVTPTHVTINEPILVTFTHPKKDELNPEVLRGKLLSSGRFILLKETFSETANDKKFEWTLEPLVSGEYPLSLYNLEIGGKPLYTPIVRVLIDPFTAPESAPQISLMSLTPDISPSLSESNQALLHKWQQQQPEHNRALINSKKFPWILLFIALLLLIIGPIAYLFYEKRRAIKEVITPEQKALATIENLEEGHYQDSDDLIVKLSSSLREYLKEKYQLSAPHQTTEEFLASTASHPLLNSGQGEKLKLFLQASDQVKFAGREPSSKEIETAIQFAKNFITSNTPKDNAEE